MGIFNALSRLLRRKSQEEALQSDLANALERSQSDFESHQSALNRSNIASKSLEIERSPKESSSYKTNARVYEPTPRIYEPVSTLHEPSKSVELQKESLQLGIAAGYTGKSLREIESSLNRIEHQMITRDWFNLQFEDKTPELIELLRQHDEKTEKALEAIQISLDSLRGIAKISPEPIRTQLTQEIQALEAKLPLTIRMKEILEIAKEAGEISYEDLAKKLNLTEISGLRGLLSNMMKRTNEIERFEKDRKGWIKYTGKAL